MSGYFLIQFWDEFGSQKLPRLPRHDPFFCSEIPCSFIKWEWISGQPSTLRPREDVDVPRKALQRTKYFQGEATVTSSSLNFSVEKVHFWELLDGDSFLN